jgi:hypothetical protein
MCRDRLYGFENTGQEFLNSLQGWVSNSVSVESHQGQCQIAHAYLKPIEQKSEKDFIYDFTFCDRLELLEWQLSL